MINKIHKIKTILFFLGGGLLCAAAMPSDVSPATNFENAVLKSARNFEFENGISQSLLRSLRRGGSSGCARGGSNACTTWRDERVDGLSPMT
jgi:hypothetical protein